MRAKLNREVNLKSVRSEFNLQSLLFVVAVGTPYIYMVCYMYVSAFYKKLGVEWASRFAQSQELLAQGADLIVLTIFIALLLSFVLVTLNKAERPTYFIYLFFALAPFFGMRALRR